MINCTCLIPQAKPRIGVAIGEHILDLSVVSHLFVGDQLKNNQHVFLEVTFNFSEIDQQN